MKSCITYTLHRNLLEWSRRVKMAKNVVSMGEYKFRQGFGGKPPKERDSFEELHLDLRIILKLFLSKYAGRTSDWDMEWEALNTTTH
jgi:hypothetical protein